MPPTKKPPRKGTSPEVESITVDGDTSAFEDAVVSLLADAALAEIAARRKASTLSSPSDLDSPPVCG